jgi:hypothetical protein
MGMFDDVLENVGEVRTASKGFERGTHEVIIGMVNPTEKKTKNDPKAAVIEVEVYDEADQERTGKATLYFHTEGGAKMSVAKVLGLIVHKVGEEKKDSVRNLGKKLFEQIDDPIKARDVAAKLMADKLVGAKAFFVAEPNGKYKTTNYGDLWHYPAEPQERAEDVIASGTPADPETGDEIPGFDDL